MRGREREREGEKRMNDNIWQLLPAAGIHNLSFQ